VFHNTSSRKKNQTPVVARIPQAILPKIISHATKIVITQANLQPLIRFRDPI
jgi:hypothetical protein